MATIHYASVDESPFQMGGERKVYFAFILLMGEFFDADCVRGTETFRLGSATQPPSEFISVPKYNVCGQNTKSLQ